jgi:hypothetical protein
MFTVSVYVNDCPTSGSTVDNTPMTVPAGIVSCNSTQHGTPRQRQNDSRDVATPKQQQQQ